jgi:hypothetical protein
MFERALWARAALRRDEADLLVVEVHAVGQERASVESPCVRQACGNSHPVYHDGVALVDGVLCGVDVQADPELPDRGCALRERLVGEREGRVCADQPSRQRHLLAAHALDEATVLRKARQRALGPSRSDVS